MESSLGKLIDMETSLLQMKSRLQNISKNEAKSIESIQKAFLTSVSVINKKLKECRTQNKRKDKILAKDILNSTKIGNIKQQKLINQKQLSKSKQMLNQIKLNESQQIKSQSIANSRAILQIKNAYLQQNRQFTKKIKEEREKSKNKVLEYHLCKSKQLKEQRQKEEEQKKQRIEKLSKEMAIICQKENLLQSRYKQKQELLKNLTNAVRKMEKMKVQEFTEIKKRVQLRDKDRSCCVNEQEAQKILKEVMSSLVPVKSSDNANFVTQ